MPSLWLSLGNINPIKREQIKEGIITKSLNIKSTNDALINCGEFRANKSSLKNQKVAIYAYGNADYFENHVDDLFKEAKKNPNLCVVGFNFRGVRYSQGKPTSQADFVNDAIVRHKTIKAFQRIQKIMLWLKMIPSSIKMQVCIMH